MSSLLDSFECGCIYLKNVSDFLTKLPYNENVTIKTKIVGDDDYEIEVKIKVHQNSWDETTLKYFADTPGKPANYCSITRINDVLESCYEVVEFNKGLYELIQQKSKMNNKDIYEEYLRGNKFITLFINLYKSKTWVEIGENILSCKKSKIEIPSDYVMITLSLLASNFELNKEIIGEILNWK